MVHPLFVAKCQASSSTGAKQPPREIETTQLHVHLARHTAASLVANAMVVKMCALFGLVILHNPLVLYSTSLIVDSEAYSTILYAAFTRIR